MISVKLFFFNQGFFGFSSCNKQTHFIDTCHHFIQNSSKFLDFLQYHSPIIIEDYYRLYLSKSSKFSQKFQMIVSLVCPSIRVHNTLFSEDRNIVKIKLNSIIFEKSILLEIFSVS